MLESMQELHIQNLTHCCTADFERRNIRSVCYDFATQNCLNTECVSTRVPSGVPKSPKWIYPLWAFYYVELGCAERPLDFGVPAKSATLWGEEKHTQCLLQFCNAKLFKHEVCFDESPFRHTKKAIRYSYLMAFYYFTKYARTPHTKAGASPHSRF